MSTSAFVVARGQQVITLLLSTEPLAERMLLYQVAMTAWIMFPQQGLLAKALPSCRGQKSPNEARRV
jgi:hypothetical protein